MNLRRINYHCSCGSCDECTGGNAKSYFEGMTQVPNIEQTVPIPGPAGKASLTVASVTDGTTDTAGTDVAIGGSTIADLTTLGFDVTTKPTLKVTPDPTDLNNTKVFIRESNGFLNFLASFKTKLLPSGSEGNILKYVSGLWTSAAPDWEKYNTTTTSPYVFSGASVGVSVPLTVGAGLAYRFKHVVAVVDPSDSDKYMEGVVESYSGTLLTIKIKNVKGTGNTSGYNVMLTAPEYLPYSGDPLNKNKFLYNDNGVLKYSVSSFYPGMCLPHFGVSGNIPSGFLSCDGTTQTQLDYPDLYDFLRPSGVVNQFARTPLGVLLAVDEFSLPYTIGNTLVGVDTTDSNFNESGKRYGSKNHVIVAADLPVTSPWTIPNHAHTVPNSTSNPGGATALNIDNVNTNTPATTGTSSVSLVHNPNTGGGTALSLFQPSIACIWIIKT